MELLRYFYHSYHLGSSSWITDRTDDAIQHLHYLPYGEDWVEHRTISWTAPYTFSSKEKDVETGYGYFGARYYDSGLSIWLSVDPMSDKYPNQTNYVYCSNNPILIIDPTGEDEYFNEFGVYLGSDGSSSTKIRIISQNFYNQLPKVGENVLFAPLAIILLQSTLLSQSDLPISSYKAIFQHYNTTNLKIKEGNAETFRNYSDKFAYVANFDNLKQFYSDELQVPFYRIKGDSFYDDYNVVINSFDHEKGHQTDRIESGARYYDKSTNEKERYAIGFQINQPSFQNIKKNRQETIKKHLDQLSE